MHFMAAMLFLFQPVNVMEDISDQTVADGEAAMFQCNICINYPEISLSWYKGTQKLESGDKYDIGSDGDRHWLKIKSCQSQDQGNYRVVCGPHISNAKLSVSGRTQTLLTRTLLFFCPRLSPFLPNCVFFSFLNSPPVCSVWSIFTVVSFSFSSLFFLNAS